MSYFYYIYKYNYSKQFLFKTLLKMLNYETFVQH